MPELEKIAAEIEIVRSRLYQAAADKDYCFVDQTVNGLSSELDQLIVKYQLKLDEIDNEDELQQLKIEICEEPLMRTACSGPDRPVWAEIDLSAIAHNVKVFMAKLPPQTRFCAVVKADAYGHGAVAVAKQALQAGASYLAVAILSEAIELRKAEITAPILVLGYTALQDAPIIVDYDITQTVFTQEAAAALSHAAELAGKKVKVHIKVDTGMGRIGAGHEAAEHFAEAVAALPGIELEGIFSHLATADSQDLSFARQQIARFQNMLERLVAKSINIPIRHLANTAATLALPEAYFDMVRVGIGLYGLYPSDEVIRDVELYPAMQLKARVVHVKEVAAGTPISYGCTYIAPEVKQIATLPIGYADGWSRLLSGKASVVLHGQRAPIVGRICMDQCMIDVTGLPAVVSGDEVVLFGGSILPVEEIATLLGTINYEVVCMVGKRVPRYYLRTQSR